MELYEYDIGHESAELGMDDIADDISKFEAKSKQKSSVKSTKPKPSAPKPIIRQAPVNYEKEKIEADRTELKNQILCDQLYKKYFFCIMIDLKN